MGHYSVALNVPANTLIGAPASGSIVLPAGILKHISIFFPPGCARMVPVIIKDGATQVYPKGAATYYAEDAKSVEIDTNDIYDSSKTLTLNGWSPGTGYPHNVIFTFTVQTIEECCMQRTNYY